MKPSFCAICTAPSKEFVQCPLGRGDALVWICADCDSSPAVADDGPDRGYEVQTTERIGAILPAFARGANRVSPPKPGWNSPRKLVSESTPGFVIVRVPVMHAGRRIDAIEALDTLRAEPWFAELRQLGSDTRFHLFERPDSEAAAATRRESNVDVIAGLATLSGGRR